MNQKRSERKAEWRGRQEELRAQEYQPFLSPTQVPINDLLLCWEHGERKQLGILQEVTFPATSFYLFFTTTRQICSAWVSWSRDRKVLGLFVLWSHTRLFTLTYIYSPRVTNGYQQTVKVAWRNAGDGGLLGSSLLFSGQVSRERSRRHDERGLISWTAAGYRALQAETGYVPVANLISLECRLQLFSVVYASLSRSRSLRCHATLP